MAVAAAEKYPSVVIDTGDHTPIADDEIVFVLRAQDARALATLECYLELCIAGDSPPEHIAAVRLSIEQFEAWQRNNPERVKSPD